MYACGNLKIGGLELAFWLEHRSAASRIGRMKPRVRSAVDQILAFNRRFPRAQLQGKLERMTASHFTFFRATFHLFAYDLRDGWCRDWPLANVEGPIIGDLHTENFGAYRAVTDDIVYDINDFDEATEGSYEID